MVPCPGLIIWMIPPQLHVSLEELFRAGIFATITVDEPGAHGAAITGIQGIGVKTPKLAAVADATVGFAIDWHIPKGRMLTNGILSIILAIGILVTTLFTGVTIKVPGASPKLHCNVAPPHTQIPIKAPLL